MEQEEIMNKYLTQAGKYQKGQGALSMAGGFADIAGSMIDYQALKGEMSNYRIQANQVELQAKQRANQLREQFLGAVGQYTTNASRRGISIASGSVRQNIESSAISLGKDIQRQDENARMQANVLRGQAKVYQRQAKGKMYKNIANSINSMIGGYQNYQMGSTLMQAGGSGK